uniref:Hypothethical protein (Modular protein) n=1 Tax=Ralstonia solanacearum TaxID=305 RepID=A0A0S4U0Q9_RALSL|nr:Hypothethical protein (modular protein) [Ralstonia solanacearum]
MCSSAAPTAPPAAEDPAGAPLSVQAATVANPASAALFMKRRRPGALGVSSCGVDGECGCLLIIDPPVSVFTKPDVKTPAHVRALIFSVSRIFGSPIPGAIDFRHTLYK